MEGGGGSTSSSMKAWWIILVAATLTLTWVTTIPPAAATAPSRLRYNYDTFTFALLGATPVSYQKSSTELRQRLSSGRFSHLIPVMRDQTTVHDSQRYVLFKLVNYDGRSITLAIDVVNAQLVAYQADCDRSFFPRDAPDVALSSLFVDTVQTLLSFSFAYADLEKVAEAKRPDINIGPGTLDAAITSLIYTACSPPEISARSLIVSIQMVLEAVRFRYVENFVASQIRSHQNYPPDATMISLENQWDALSAAIQQSNQGVFSKPVELSTDNLDKPLQVDSVGPVVTNWVALLLFKCEPSAGTKYQDRANFPLLLRSIEQPTCQLPQPTVHIAGQNGLCLEVQSSTSSARNVLLQPCKSDGSIAQLWTLKGDGTVQSSGGCLAASNSGPHVGLYSCASTGTSLKQWQVWDNGTIVRSLNGLSLTAVPFHSNRGIAALANNYSAIQGWRATNTTPPLLASITGLDGYCLQASNNNGVSLEACDRVHKTGQHWAIYPDGSIRTVGLGSQYCLVSTNEVEGSSIAALACSGSSRERWMFQNNGTISNLRNGFVIGVKNEDPSLKQIVISSSTGAPGQIWNIIA